MANSNSKANSRRHARKVTLDAALSNAIAKAVDARKVAAFTVGAAGVLAGAAFAFGATPAMAAEAGAAPDTKPAAVAAGEKAVEKAAAAGEKAGEKADAGKKASTGEKGKDAETGNSDEKGQADEKGQTDKKEDVNKAVKNTKAEQNVAKEEQTKQSVVKTEDKKSDSVTTDGAKTETTDLKATATYSAASSMDRAATPAESKDPNKINPDTSDSTNTKIEINDNNAETMPNMYGWGSTENTFSEDGEKHTVTFHFAAPKDGGKITNIAIFPAQNNGLTNAKSKRGAEYYSGDPNMHQSFSGNYTFTTNNQDGSATLTMSNLFRNGNIGAAEKYAANRSIFVYVTAKDGTTTIYKTNAFRAATLVPPKTAGSVVLKYNQPLTEEKVQAAITAAANAETARGDKKSVNDQLTAASTSNGVFTRENGKAVQVADTTDGKIKVKSADAYDKTTFDAINTKKTGDANSYVAGAKTLNTYMVTDLGFKSGAIPLTVARYDDRIDKPIVEDPTKLSAEVKEEIKKKLAKINGVSSDKITFDGDDNAVINFDGVDAKDAPKIDLRDLVLKKLEEKDITVPAADKATFVTNPLAYSDAEIKSIKKAIYEANKDNQELGLSEKDYENQISLEYLQGNLTASGTGNQGISNGQAENTITVKIKTDKAVAEFTSNIKARKLTKLPDIRKDYNVTWTADKIEGRDTDEGISWSNDQKTTIIYRYDSTKAEEFDTNKILKLLKAKPKDPKSGLRDLTGGEQLAYEGIGNNAKKSHVGYVLKDDQPTTELSLGNMNGAYWEGVQTVSNSGVDLGDNLSEAGSYSWDKEAGSVTVAGKKGKIYKARLFVLPYGLTMYRNIYMENGNQPWNTPKAINVIFVPQTNHKTSNLKDSIDEHAVTNDDKKTPTDSKYYNASKDKKDAYDKALKVAQDTLKKVGTTADADLSEELKAEVDNATINLNKARAELDGDKTDKEKLKASIDENGKAAEGNNPATLTQATNQFKNVSDPDFKTPDGKPDTDKNAKAAAAKEAYEKALEEANTVNSDDNATQKAVDDAKAKLDEARAKLNEFTTSKDELNNAIAQHGKVNTGDADKQGEAKLKTADPTYQNSSDQERKDYDAAVKKAGEVAADPNASQKEVNKAIEALKKAKADLDKNATDKSPLDAAVQKSLDKDSNKHSVFYTNAKNKTGDTAAQQAVQNYDDALAKAKQVLADDKATKKDVEDAKKALEDAEKVLYAETYQTKATDLAEAIADNVSGYLMPAYFNAFDLAQSKDPADTEKAKQAAKDFKAYNDAYHAAKDLLKDIKNPNSTVTQDQADKVKKTLEEARKAIDKYATDTSKISAALIHHLAITNSPAYKNASATDATEEATKAVKAYDDAFKELQKAFNDQMDKDKDDRDNEIPESVTPDKDIDMTNADALKKLQQHAKGQPLNRDVTKLLTKLNDAVKGLDKFKTKTDELIKSINEDATTHPSPAFKNASLPSYQKPDGSGADDTKNAAAKKAVDEYGEALNKAKDLLNDPNATQAQINEAKKNLDEKRKALDDYKTDVSKLQESANKHGKEKQGDADATEGTVTSDAYRNASDPHFVDENGTPDEAKNQQARDAKTAYDKALAKAQELLAKHNDANTPQDAKPTQKDINDALDALDKARKKLDDNYKTVTTKLDEEAKKSTADGAAQPTAGSFEDSPEFKNADDKKGEGNKDNDDVAAYKKALKAARDLLAKKDSATLSERPTQQQIDEALDALKKAKQTITDSYKTNVTALNDAKDFVNNVLKKSPEYNNALALKDDDKADQDKKGKAKAAVEALDDTVDSSALKKAKAILDKFDNQGKPKQGETNIPTQKEVDAALKTLQDAMDKVTKEYKTDAKLLENEVGDKNAQGNPVTPPFEASVAYKNALEKAKTEENKTSDDSATKKLEDYNKKLKAAQDLIAQVNSTDPNVDSSTKPTQKQVDEALKALQNAKKAITDGFKTKVDDLKTEAAKSTADTTDPAATPTAGSFESTTEYQNALAKKTDDGKENADVTAYKEALSKARTLLGKFDDSGNVKKDQTSPSQQEVDEALKNLKEIKDKITKNYVTSPHDLQQEFDKSKDGADDNRGGLFEDTPAFKNAEAAKDEGGKDNTDMAAYKKALEDAKALLDKFDRTTGKPKPGETAPTQKKLDDALKALQDAKSKIEKDYATKKEELKTEADAGADFTKSPEYVNAQSKGDDASKQALEDYKKALDEANSVLKDPNATQAQVDEALKKLQEAKKKINDDYGTSKHELRIEHSDYSSFESSPEFINVISNLKANPDDESAKSAIDNYKKALEDANKVLGDPNATQAQVDAALSRLRDAKNAITQKYATDKKNLKDEHEADSDFENSPEFQNAAGTPEAEAYKKALEDAKKVLNDPNATQAQVDEALRKLRDAKNALVNGHKTNKADLQNEADDDPVFRNGVPYLIAGSTDAEAYKKALDEARRVLDDPNATQAQVDAALRKLREAKQRIIDKFNTRGNGFDGYVPNAGGHEGDGYANNANANAVDKSALQAEINSALNVRGNSAAAQAYKKALAEAKRVLADANATQAQVDAAVKQLRDAKAAVNGFGGNHKIAKTGASTGLFAGLAAIFAGFGAAGVASRRRKHSNE